MVEQDEPGIIDSLIAQIRDYGETRLSITKLKAVDKASEAIGSVSVYVLISLIGTITLLFLSVATALLLGEWLESYSSGFFLVTGALAVTGMVVYLQRNTWIRDPVTKRVIIKMLE